MENSAVVNLAAFIPLFREIGNLKRIRAANSSDPFAANLCRRAWSKIKSSAEARAVAVKICTDAIVEANLGAIDARVLQVADLTETEIKLILRRAFDVVAAPINEIDENLRNELCKQTANAISKC